MDSTEDRFLEHPSYPYKLEMRGQEFIRHYPTGAEAIASSEEWLLLILLIRLGNAIGDEKLKPVDMDAPVDHVTKLVDENIPVIEAKRGRKAK